MVFRAAPGSPWRARRKNRGALAIRRDRLRELWSEVVRTRDGFKCQRCGRTKEEGFQIDAAHILPVGSYPNLKFVVANGISMCTIPCHRWFDQNRGGRNHDGEGATWVKGVIGIDGYAKLLVLAKTFSRPSKTMTAIALHEELRRVKDAAD
jgi:hypothetical protein